MAFLLDGKPLAVDVPFSVGETNYPANWLRLTTKAEKEAIGIYNASGKDIMSIYEMVERMADFYQCDKSQINRISSTTLNQKAKLTSINKLGVALFLSIICNFFFST